MRMIRTCQVLARPPKKWKVFQLRLTIPTRDTTNVTETPSTFSGAVPKPDTYESSSYCCFEVNSLAILGYSGGYFLYRSMKISWKPGLSKSAKLALAAVM